MTYSMSALLEKIKSIDIMTANKLDIGDGLKNCNIAVRRICKKLKAAKSVGKKQNLLANLALVKSYRCNLKCMLKHGAGVQSLKETAAKRVRWDDSLSAFESRLRTGIISNLKHKDPKAFLKDCEALFRRRISNVLKIHEAIKVNVIFCGEFQIVSANKMITEHKYFTTSNNPIYRNTNVNEWFGKNVVGPITRDLEEFEERNSGWTLVNIINLGININKYTPLLGSSYIELPTQIKRREACINVKNNDDACFAWTVISALYPIEKDPQRVSKYPHYSKVLKLKGIQFPMTLKQVPCFENQNQISINIYILRKHLKNFNVVPCYLTKNKLINHVNLLLIQDQYDDIEDDCNDNL